MPRGQAHGLPKIAMLSRRKFIKQLGIALVALPAVCCVPKKPLPTLSPMSGNEPTRQMEPFEAQVGDLPPEPTRQVLAAFSRDRLRTCWIGLDVLAQRTAGNSEQGEWTRLSLVAEHRLALDDLLSLGELREAVAVQVQIAFEEAAYHVWSKAVSSGCCGALPAEYAPREDFVQNVEKLFAVQGVESDDIDQVRTALEHDLACLVQLRADHADVDRLVRHWTAGKIQVGAETVAAVQFLIDLLFAMP